MIAVPVGHNDEVQLREVDVFRFGVLGENVGVVSCIEQNAFAAIFDKGGIAPVLLHRRSLAEGVIEDGDLGLGWIDSCVGATGVRGVSEKKQKCRRAGSSGHLFTSFVRRRFLVRKPQSLDADRVAQIVPQLSQNDLLSESTAQNAFNIHVN